MTNQPHLMRLWISFMQQLARVMLFLLILLSFLSLAALSLPRSSALQSQHATTVHVSKQIADGEPWPSPHSIITNILQPTPTPDGEPWP